LKSHELLYQTPSGARIDEATHPDAGDWTVVERHTNGRLMIEQSTVYPSQRLAVNALISDHITAKDAVLFSEFWDCITGVSNGVAVYDYARCIKALESRGMSKSDAREYIGFNIQLQAVGGRAVIEE